MYEGKAPFYFLTSFPPFIGKASIFRDGAVITSDSLLLPLQKHLCKDIIT